MCEMGSRIPVKLGCVLAVIFLFQHTVAKEECRSGCKGGSHDLFKYAQGTTYKYNYEGKIDITLSTAEGQQTGSEIKAIVLLSQQDNCNQILRLQNVEIFSENGKKFGTIPGIEKPISINFHDGHIEDSICVDPSDNQNSINIKRAITSLFQANLGQSHETDIFGLCPTDISSKKEGNIVHVQKYRNLNACAYRENIKQGFITTTFNTNSEIKSSPILNGDYDAKLSVKNGILEKATIVEHYLFVPFSVGKSGAKALVTSKLQLTGTSKDVPKSTVSQARSIIFENPHPVDVETNNVNNILNAIKETAKTIDITVNEHTAKEFVNLIRILRVSRKDDILAVYNQVKAGVGFNDKQGAKKIFLDALYRVGNGNSIEVAIALIKNKELSPLEEKLVYLGFSFVNHVTKESLSSVQTLLAQPNLLREAYLGIGHLVGQFCQQHSCEKNDIVEKVIEAFTSKLVNSKPTNRDQENEIIYILKGLKNIRYLQNNVLSKLTGIAQDKKAPNRLRVAALQTFLADPCQDKLRDSALSILRDVQQDSEIRIRAYLALAQCPNAKVGQAIKKLLIDEPSYQVGGFIVSHIRNIRASTNPDKELSKQHLNFLSLPNKYPIDFRKWSYNGEFSYAIDTLGVANSLEANLIYSQQSFLPRSTSLNLTAEIFGHTFNFLEIETRQENLDRLVEHYFGPKGLLRSTSIFELYKNREKEAEGFVNKLSNKLRETLRARRDVSKAEIEAVGKKVHINTNELNNNLDLDLSIKTFGSELIFLNLNDDVKKYSPDVLIDKFISEFGKGLDKIKNFQETLRSNMLFLDVEFSYPTSLGFPLKLSVEGSSTVQIKSEGNIDIRSLINQKDTNFKLKLIPSANVEISGQLTLDAFVVENGLKVISTLHTSTGGDLSVSIKNGGSGLDIKYGLPVKEQKLLSASHEIVFYTRERASRERNAPIKFAQNKDFSVCVDHLKSFIGLTFCGEINGPNLSGKQVPVLPFPLAGDAKVAITIENEDVAEYHLKNHVDPNKAEFSVETIGKNGEKKVSLQLKASINPEKFVRAELISPVKKASAEGRIIYTDNEKSLSIRLVNDEEEYSGKVGVQVSGSPAKSTYKPIFELKTPSGPQKLPYDIQGQIIVENNGQNFKYTFDNVKAIVSDQKTVALKGNLGRENGALFTDLVLSDNQNSVSVTGRLQANANLLKFNTEVKNTFNPEANINLKGELKRQTDKVDCSLQLIHGPNLSSKINILTITNSFTKKYKSSQDFELATKNTVSYPLFSVNSKLEYELTPKSLHYDVNLGYKDVNVGSELDLKSNQKEKGDYELEFDVYGFDNKLNVKSSRKVINDESDISNQIDLNGKKIEVAGKVRHHLKPTIVDIGCDVVVKVPTHKSPIKINGALKLQSNDIDTYQKITADGNVIVDFFLKANKAGNANGILKVNIKDILTVNGQLKSSSGSGNGNLLVELQAIKRQIKTDTTFTIQAPNTYNVEINLYPKFNEDKNAVISVSTVNKINENNVDSKNVINVLGHKLAVNAKGSIKGQLYNGKINGEVEVTLPDERYLIGKVNLDRKVANNVVNGNGQLSVECRKNKNTPGRKISWNGQVKNSNLREGIYDGEHHLSIDSGEGYTFNTDLAFVLNKNGENREYDLKHKLSGSSFKDPIEGTFKGNCNKGVGQHDMKITFGPNSLAALNVKTNLHGDSDGRSSGEVKFDLHTPSKVLKSLKLGGAISGKRPKTENDYWELNGSASVVAEDLTTTIVNIETNSNLKINAKDGIATSSYKSNKIDPITVALGYGLKEQGNEKQFNGNVALQYGQGKNVKLDASLIKPAPHEYKLILQLDLPTETHKSNKLLVNTKRTENPKRVTSHVELSSDGKVWTSDSDFELSPVSPSFKIVSKSYDGKVSEIFIKVSHTNPKHFGGEIKLVNEHKNFLLEGTLDSNVESVDDFIIKVTVHSPSLKLNKLVLEGQNKPSKTGRRIQVTGKSDSSNLISGSTSYTTREENGKYIVEGSGSVKVKEETKSANFKYSLERLSLEKNGEQGIDISFDASLGNGAVDAEFKLTNKQFRILNSYCEEKKQCAHIEFDSKTIVNDVHSYNHELEIAIDLRKLGVSHEFGLKSITKRKNYALDHTVDIHFQSPENSKFQYSLYIHPGAAGISLTTPKRTIALELNIAHESNKNKKKISGDVTFYLDKKNHANKKSSLEGWVEMDDKNEHINGKLVFVHPGLDRPLSISVNDDFSGGVDGYKSKVELDVFANPNQKVTVTWKAIASDSQHPTLSEEIHITSTGLGIDILALQALQYDKVTHESNAEVKLSYKVGKSKFENIISSKISKDKADFLVKLLNVDLLHVASKYKYNKEELVIDIDINSFNKQPLVSHLECKNWNTVKYSAGVKGQPTLQFTSGLIPGQVADARAEYVEGGKKTNLFHVTFKLDDANFLKPEYGVDSKEVDKFVQNTKEGITKYTKGLKNVGKEWHTDVQGAAQEVKDISKKATPNFKPVVEYYKTELNNFKNEILDDKTIKEFSEYLKNLIAITSKALTEIFENFSTVIENIAHVIQSSFGKVVESIEKDLWPLFKTILDKIAHTSGEILKTSIEIVLTYLAKLSKIAEQLQPEFKQIATSLNEITQEFRQFSLHAYEHIRQVVQDLIKKVSEELKSLPVLEELKTYYNELMQNGLPNAESVINSLTEIATTIKDGIPEEFKEVKDLIDTVVEFVTKKLRKEKVDTVVYLERIVKSVAGLGKKLIQTISKDSADLEIGHKDIISVDFLTKLPRLVAIRFSPFSHLLKEESVGLGRFVLSLFTAPRNWFAPFPMSGKLIQGQHIFTFDEKHLTFPGNCKYLIARDAVNGNFTIIGTFENGFLNAITLSDKEDSITLKKGGNVLLNNGATELPIRKPLSNPQISAYRSYEIVILRSTAGVKLICSPDLEFCVAYISGFYHGQLRGLLGNGNNEPYDDFTTVNGKIVESEEEFGNSYKLTASCPTVTVPSHENQENSECSKLFGWESSLRYCYPFVNTDNYKMACAHGLNAKIPNTETAIAKAYVGACNERNIPIVTPSKFLKCANSEKPFNVGEEFSVKLPGKAADIVLIVDTSKTNEQLYKELVQPLVQEVGKSLHTKGINDVEFHLITFGGQNQWPSHVTVSGKLTFKGKSPNLKFADELSVEKLDSKFLKKYEHVEEVLHKVIHGLKLALGLDLQALTYSEALQYPFRTHAVKSLIVAVSKPCEKGSLLPLQKLRALFYKNDLLKINLITPFENVISKDSKKAKDVVGFNKENVFTLSQGKKKPEGSQELHKDLQFDDFCVDFTLKNGGNIFVSENFQQAKADNKKQYIQIAAHNIVSSLTDTEQQLNCECKTVNQYSAQNVCRSAYIKENGKTSGTKG